MGKIERAWRKGFSRREALSGLATFLAASPRLHAQRDPWPLDRHRRILGFNEMQTAFDFEPVFRANVPLSTYDYTAHDPVLGHHTLRLGDAGGQRVSLVQARHDHRHFTRVV